MNLRVACGFIYKQLNLKCYVTKQSLVVEWLEQYTGINKFSGSL